MNKTLKILASLLLVTVITLVTIPYFYKDEIVDFVKKDVNNLLNANVDFEDVNLSLFKDFPNFHLQLNHLTVDGKDAFQNLQLMNVDKVGFSFNLKSVLFGDQILINKFSANNATINVRVLPDGLANYDIIKKDTISDSDELTSFDIKLKEYTINSTDITYSDESLGFHMLIKNLNHKGKAKLKSDLYELTTHSTIDSLDLSYNGIRYINNVVATLDTDLDIKGDFTTYTIKNTHLLINDLPITAEGSFDLNEDEILIDLVYKTPDASLVKLLSLIPKAYMPDLRGVTSTGVASLNGFVKGKSTDLIIPGFSLNIIIKDATLQYPDLPEKLKNINAVTNISFKEGSNLDKIIIDLPNIQFDIADNTARGNLKITQVLSDPLINTKFTSILDFNTIKNTLKFRGVKKLEGQLDADFSLKGLLSAIEKQEYDKFEADGFFKLDNFEFKSDSLDYGVKILKARLNVRPEALQINEFEANIKNSDFNLKGTISNYIAYALGKEENLKAKLYSHSKYINMNDFMNSSEIADSTQTELIKIPKNLIILLTSTADKLTYKDMDIQDAKGVLKLKDEQANLSAVFMKSMGGNIKMNGLYDTSGSFAKTDVSFSLDNMPIKESANTFSVFHTYAPILQSITGQFFSNMDFSVNLDQQMNPILSSVNAKGTFKTNEIYPEGVVILNKVGNLIKLNELTNANIDKLNASFKIKDGTISISPVDFKLNNMQASFQGDFNLNQELDLDFFLDVPREELGANINQVLESFIGGLNFLKLDSKLGDIVNMKFKITGTALSPKIKPIILGRAGETLIETVTDIVEDKIDAVKNEALLKAQVESDKLMQIAVEQKEKLVDEAEKLAQEVREKADLAADGVIKKAGKDNFKLIAAKVAADKIRKQGNKNAEKLLEKAETKGDDLIDIANNRSNELLAKAMLKDSIN